LLTARFHVHAFFALLIACFVVGLGVQCHFLLLWMLLEMDLAHHVVGLIIVLRLHWVYWNIPAVQGIGFLYRLVGNRNGVGDEHNRVYCRHAHLLRPGLLY
jgi:hypothetical protein